MTIVMCCGCLLTRRIRDLVSLQSRRHPRRWPDTCASAGDRAALVQYPIVAVRIQEVRPRAGPMMTELTWILDELVVAIHHRQLAWHGGSVGIRSEQLLGSALARPGNLCAYGTDPDVAALAAAYAFGIVRNHPFVDGNKRTKYVVCRTFLILNGYDLDAPADQKHLTIVKLAEGRLGEEELAEWIRRHLRS